MLVLIQFALGDDVVKAEVLLGWGDAENPLAVWPKVGNTYCNCDGELEICAEFTDVGHAKITVDVTWGRCGGLLERTVHSAALDVPIHGADVAIQGDLPSLLVEYREVPILAWSLSGEESTYTWYTLTESEWPMIEQFPTTRRRKLVIEASTRHTERGVEVDVLMVERRQAVRSDRGRNPDVVVDETFVVDGLGVALEGGEYALTIRRVDPP